MQSTPACIDSLLDLCYNITIALQGGPCSYHPLFDKAHLVYRGEPLLSCANGEEAQRGVAPQLRGNDHI